MASSRAAVMTPTSMSRSLSHRELAVMKWLALGKTVAVTAEILGISAKTVESHRSSIYAKLDITSRAQLAEMAIGIGIIPMPGASAVDTEEELRGRLGVGFAELQEQTPPPFPVTPTQQTTT